MGQKINPIGFRVSVNKDWRSRWYAENQNYGNLLHEDLQMRSLVKERLKDAAVPQITIERYANRARITVYTARPGIVIGRRGEDIDKLRAQLSEISGKEIYIEIKEIKNADLDAQLVAENIAVQLERRVSFRRAMKRALGVAMDMGALGIKIETNGRLGGSELARRESYKEGMIPLHTLRANIDYGFAEANTTAGKIGIKVWVCKKDEDLNEKEKANASYA